MKKNQKFLSVAQMRDLEKQLSAEDISYSRMVEMINELAFEHHQSQIKEQDDHSDQWLENFMTDVNAWADQTFGSSRKVVSVLHHLKQEVPELIEALEKHGEVMGVPLGTPAVEMEFADCFILLCNAAKKYGLSAALLKQVSELKMQINKERKWGKPDENGVVNHVKEPVRTYVTTAGGHLIEDSE